MVLSLHVVLHRMALGGCSCLFKMQPTFFLLFFHSTFSDTIVGLLLGPLGLTWPIGIGYQLSGNKTGSQVDCQLGALTRVSRLHVGHIQTLQ